MTGSGEKDVGGLSRYGEQGVDKAKCKNGNRVAKRKHGR